MLQRVAALMLGLVGCTGGAISSSSGGTSGAGGAGTTAPICDNGFADCDADASNACEVNLSTDPENCGACSRSCAGGMCQDGICQTFTVAANAHALDCVADEDELFWLQEDTVVHKPSGGQVKIIASGDTFLINIAVDSQNVYWTNGHVMRAALRSVVDPNPHDIADLGPDLTAEGGISLDSGYVYYSSLDATPPCGVFRLSKSGGLPEPLFILPQSQNAFCHGAVVDSSNVYWLLGDSEDTVSSVQSVPKQGGQSTALAHDVWNHFDYFTECFKADDSNLYWVNGVDNIVWTIPKLGGEAEKIAAIVGNCNSLVVDNQYVYIATSAPGRLMQIDKLTKDVHIVAEEETAVECVAVSSTLVYWFASGALKAVSK